MRSPLLLLLSLTMCFLSCDKDPVTETPPDPVCEPTEAELALAEDLSMNFAYLFDGDDPAVDDPQLDRLIDYLGEVPLVGLGEATHGTAEFFRMKDKIFRQLVLQKGFKAIVFEIPWGNALGVNDFVVNGGGSADAAVDQTYYWVYDTQEVRDLAQWMRDYNEGRPLEDRIWFVGCDPQGGDFAYERNRVRTFLQTYQPDSAAHILMHYDQLPSSLDDYSASATDPAVLEANRQGTMEVYDFLERHREELVELSSPLTFEIALMAAHVIQHREYIYRIGDSGVPRDSLMAVYSDWWQRILGEDAQLAIWAHNAHVMDGAYFNADWMGTFLRRWRPQDYRNVGFSFSTGSMNAFLAGSNGQFLGGVREQFVLEPPCHSSNHLLSLVEGDQHYLLFHELTGNARSYFQAEQGVLQMGAGYNNSLINAYTSPRRLSSLYNALIHFDETNASELK